MSNRPCPSVTAVRAFSISTGLAASTATPGSTAPLSSVTTPAIRLCALASAATNMNVHKHTDVRATRPGMRCPPVTPLVGRPLLFRKGEAENQIPSPSAPLAAARRDGHKLLTIDRVDRRRGIHPGAGVELPEEVAGFRVVGEEVTRDITPGPDEHHVAGGNDRPGLAPALEAPLPDELSRGRVER